MSKSHITITPDRHLFKRVLPKKFMVTFSPELYTFLGYPNTCRDTIKECCAFIEFYTAKLDYTKEALLLRPLLEG